MKSNLTHFTTPTPKRKKTAQWLLFYVAQNTTSKPVPHFL